MSDQNDDGFVPSDEEHRTSVEDTKVDGSRENTLTHPALGFLASVLRTYPHILGLTEFRDLVYGDTEIRIKLSKHKPTS